MGKLARFLSGSYLPSSKRTRVSRRKQHDEIPFNPPHQNRKSRLRLTPGFSFASFSPSWGGGKRTGPSALSLVCISRPVWRRGRLEVADARTFVSSYAICSGISFRSPGVFGPGRRTGRAARAVGLVVLLTWVSEILLFVLFFLFFFCLLVVWPGGILFAARELVLTGL
ncbi:hypothetical protein SODALDRAFT_144763 [Sodiomyces alkalinus F11]|uniref:Uncharacterized protein n=1 Tax=Sodiomyces alkalinus (strain CBS 110278 / VKM F-3762 / F11) TaxID=1314773 RepID=A0A3N2PZW0_SODAK|nr:hypothetical protein SODALDRAFT_144763 [Sodiomyces alkalinus F11]ROT40060.1 hypothetical protein SODALDRAFT_144763 [Sodiomyces alkalinus F11]